MDIERLIWSIYHDIQYLLRDGCIHLNSSSAGGLTDLLLGKKVIVSQDALARRRRRGGWRKIRAFLANYVEQELEPMADAEVKWEHDHLGQDVCKSDLYKHSAQKALKAYQNGHEPLQHLQAAMSSFVRVTKRPPIGNPATKQHMVNRRNDIVIKNSGLGSSKKTVRFNGKIYVSKTHDVDDPNKCAPRPGRNSPGVIHGGYKEPLCDYTISGLNGEGRRRDYYRRKSPIYFFSKSSHWPSPSGCRKVDTSWYYGSWADMKRARHSKMNLLPIVSWSNLLASCTDISMSLLSKKERVKKR
jgi:hypothetical protein